MSGQERVTGKCEACGSGGSWGPGDCRNAFGDEWDYVGENGCNYDCKVGSIFPGTSARCRHVRYNADKASCCLGTPVGGTCDPSWQVGNGQCDASMGSYCASDRIIKDPKCVNWRNQRPDAAKQVLKSYCLSHLDAPECREWCNKSGECDSAVVSWCQSHPGDPYCTCIMSPLQDPRYGINPKCNDRKCIDTGYITQNMRGANCPDITNCDVQAKLLNSGVSLAGVTINQSCGKGPDGPAQPPPVSPPSAPVWRNQLVILFAFLILVMLGVVLVASSGYVGGGQGLAFSHKIPAN